MAGSAKEAGPSSQRVAENLRRIRRERDLTTAALSRRLAEIGHPIADTGITKIEKGDRRVNVDNLVALAVALDTTPNRLLLPEVDLTRLSAEFDLTQQGTHGRVDAAWAWASGERPLGHKPASHDDDEPARDELRFIGQHRAHYIRGAAEWIAAAGEWMGQDGDEKPSARPALVGKGLVAMVILSAYTEYGLDSAALRSAAESGIVASLAQEESENAEGSEELEEFLGGVWSWLAAADTAQGDGEADP